MITTSNGFLLVTPPSAPPKSHSKNKKWGKGMKQEGKTKNKKTTFSVTTTKPGATGVQVVSHSTCTNLGI